MRRGDEPLNGCDKAHEKGLKKRKRSKLPSSSFPFLSFPFLSFPFLSFPFLLTYMESKEDIIGVDRVRRTMIITILHLRGRREVQHTVKDRIGRKSKNIEVQKIKMKANNTLPSKVQDHLGEREKKKEKGSGRGKRRKE